MMKDRIFPKEYIEELIDSYKKKITYLSKITKEATYFSEINRLASKEGAYRSFLKDLEDLLKRYD